MSQKPSPDVSRLSLQKIGMLARVFLFLLILPFAILASLIYTYKNRNHFFYDGLPWLIVFGGWNVFTFSAFLRKAYVEAEEKRRTDNSVFGCASNAFVLPRVVLANVITWLILSYTAYSLTVAGKDMLTLSDSGVLVMLSVVSLGFGLFYFRLHLRAVYGLTESFVGLAIAVQKSLAIQSDKTIINSEWVLAVVTASVYLIVRGLDNIHQGLTKEPRDPVAVTFVNGLRPVKDIAEVGLKNQTPESELLAPLSKSAREARIEEECNLAYAEYFASCEAQKELAGYNKELLKGQSRKRWHNKIRADETDEL